MSNFYYGALSTVAQAARTDMNVLGIETSCDETGVALVIGSGTIRFGSSPMHCTARSICTHPTAAWCPNSRRAITSVVSCPCWRRCSRRQAGGPTLTRSRTRAGRPGGRASRRCRVACSLAAALGGRSLGIHHLEGHLLSPFLSADPPTFPFVALLVSGGHTQLMKVTASGGTNSSATRATTRRARRSTRSPSCWGWDFPAGRCWRAAEFGNPTPSSSRARCWTAAVSTFPFPDSRLRCERRRASSPDSGGRTSLLRRKPPSSTCWRTIRCGARRPLKHLFLAGGVARTGRCARAWRANARSAGPTLHYPSSAPTTARWSRMAAAMRWQARDRTRPTRLRLRREAALAARRPPDFRGRCDP